MTVLHKSFYLLLAVTLALFVSSALLIATANGWFDPRPYWGVKVRPLQVDDDGNVGVIADFTKGHCELVKFGVDGVNFDGAFPLKYTDLDGRPEDDDRLAGDTTLRILILVDGGEYDYFDLKTRHVCNGRRVDKRFARVIPLTDPSE